MARAKCYPLLLLLGSLPACTAHAQQLAPAWADSVVEHLANTPLEDYENTMPLTRRLFAHYAARKDTCGMAEASVSMGSCYDALGTLDSALQVLLRAVAWAERGCPGDLQARAALNLSSVYLSLGEFHRADSVCVKALHPQADGTPPAREADLLFNRAVALGEQLDLAGAEAQFVRLRQLAVEQQDAAVEIDALINLGAVRGMQGDHAGAQLHLQAALRRCRETDCPKGAVIVQNLASVAEARGNFRAALALLDSAQGLARTEGDLQLQMIIARDQAKAAHDLGDDHAAWTFMNQYTSLRDSLLDVEKVKAVSDVQEKYHTERRVRQIKELEVEKLDAKLREAGLQRTRNIYLTVGLGVLVLAVGLWNRLRFVARSRAAIRREKEVSEGLLHNILPVEVADELRAKGHADAREFDRATILFTDFKGFTQLTEQLTAPELVAEIDHCFRAFDTIVERYRIEKIKTIGDAYMAAGGLPDPTHGAPADVVRAALDMQAFMAAYKQGRMAEGRLYFEMRVGIHTGPVIAGIVGSKKFAYDIWGDTVNTASRMESSGAVGEVNISGSTYALVKDASTPLGTPVFRFTPRGKVQAKGKGEMEMYFAARGPEHPPTTL